MTLCTIAKNDNVFGYMKSLNGEKAQFVLWQTCKTIAKLKTATDRLLQWKFQLQQAMHFNYSYDASNYYNDDPIFAQDALVIIAWRHKGNYYTFKNKPIYLSQGNDFKKATYRMRINNIFKRVEQIQKTWDAPHMFRLANFCKDLYPGENWSTFYPDHYESKFTTVDRQVCRDLQVSHVVVTFIC